MTGSVLIGIDIGTTAVKAVMTALAASGSTPSPRATRCIAPAPGAAEQDPADWAPSVGDALARFAAHRRAGEVGAIGITSQVNTHVFCDADLARPCAPPSPGRTPARPRGRGARRALSTPERRSRPSARPIPIDASHALSRMAWVARTEPEVWARTRHVLPKDTPSRA
jgi:xylulokinase